MVLKKYCSFFLEILIFAILFCWICKIDFVLFCVHPFFGCSEQKKSIFLSDTFAAMCWTVWLFDTLLWFNEYFFPHLDTVNRNPSFHWSGYKNFHFIRLVLLLRSILSFFVGLLFEQRALSYRTWQNIPRFKWRWANLVKNAKTNETFNYFYIVFYK